MNQEQKKKILIDALFVVFIAGLVYVLLRYLIFWVLPFVIAFLVALILQRPVRYLSKKTKLPRGIWSCVLVLTILAALVGLLIFLIYRIGIESIGFINWIGAKGPEIKEAFRSISDEFGKFVQSLPAELQSTAQSSPSALIDKAVSAVTTLLWNVTKGAVNAVPELLLAAVITTVAACFMTSDYPKIAAFILRQCNDHGKKVLLKVKVLFFENILRMLRGYILILFITFAELFLGFLILRIDYALILALLVALLDILPVVGTGTVLIPWGIVELLLGDTATGVGMLVVYLIITIIRNIIEPKIISEQVGLPPLVTLLAMYIGLRFFGVLGLFSLPILLIILSKLQEAELLHLWKTAPKSEETEGEKKKGIRLRLPFRRPPKK